MENMGQGTDSTKMSADKSAEITLNVPNFWALADNLGRYILGHFEYFQPVYKHPCFPLINHYFYKKLSLHIQIQNTYLFGIGI